MIRIADNDDDRFPGQILIENVADDGTVVWRSWAPPHIDPAIRLNPDQYPTVPDDRTDTPPGDVSYRVPSIAEFCEVSGVRRRDYDQPEPDEPGKDSHRVLATLAAVVEAVTVEAAAGAVELDPAELVAEAQAWEAAG